MSGESRGEPRLTGIGIGMWRGMQGQENSGGNRRGEQGGKSETSETPHSETAASRGKPSSDGHLAHTGSPAPVQRRGIRRVDRATRSSSSNPASAGAPPRRRQTRTRRRPLVLRAHRRPLLPRPRPPYRLRRRTPPAVRHLQRSEPRLHSRHARPCTAPLRGFRIPHPCRESTPSLSSSSRLWARARVRALPRRAPPPPKAPSPP